MFYRLCAQNPVSGLLQIGHKLGKWWRHNLPTWHHRHIFFDVVLFLLSSLVTRSSFIWNIIAGSGVTTIYFYLEMTRNPDIGNTPVWVLPNIWRLGWVKDTKFDKDISNKMSINAAKPQGYSFQRFWVIKGKPTRGVKIPLTHPD